MISTGFRTAFGLGVFCAAMVIFGCGEQKLTSQQLANAGLNCSHTQPVSGQVLNLAGCALSNVDFSRADLTNSDLSQSVVKRKTNFTYAQMRHANLKNTSLVEANFARADLKDANLQNANLTAATFTEAVLIRSDLRGANLSGATLWNADLRGANLSGANLFHAQLIGTKLDGVIWSNTTCPDGVNSDSKPSKTCN